MRKKKNDLLSVTGMDKEKKRGLVGAGLRPTKKITFAEEYRQLVKAHEPRRPHGLGDEQTAS